MNPTVQLVAEFIQSPIKFIQEIWNLYPQPVKAEFKELVDIYVNNGQWDKIELKHFDNFIRGKHITWQQWLILLAVERSLKKQSPNKISVVSGHGCHAINAPILMANGVTKMVQDIAIGDRLMGDDGTARKVLDLCRGREKMYRIQYFDGSFYDVNESHILCLVASQSHGLQTKGQITEVSARDYLKWSDRKKRTNIGYKTSYELLPKELPIDPYLFGVWLGDGSQRDGRIVNADEEVMEYLSAMSSNVYSWKGRSKKEFTIKGLRRLLYGNGLLGNKYIPDSYLVASRQQRLELLAGLLDTDGYLDKCGNYEITQKREGLAKQIWFLAKSVGCHSTINKVMKACYNSPNEPIKKPYYHVIISRNTWIVPCKIKRKRWEKPKKCQRENLHFGFVVIPLEEGDYYGFEIDGNGRYLLGDTTVTHNTGKDACLSWLILWFLFCHEDAQIGATAPTSEQMHDILWKELKIWLDKMPKEISNLYEWQTGYLRIKQKADTWFARARTARKENSEAIAGLHGENVFIAVDEACHDEETDILTENGWKRFGYLSKNERVLTLNPKTGIAEYQFPAAYHEYRHSGIMIGMNRRGMNFLVTPTHNLWAKTAKAGFRKIAANKLTLTDMYIKRTIPWMGEGAMEEEMVKLYAWFISEGSCKRYKNGLPNAICISQSFKNKENRQEIVSVIKKLGYVPHFSGIDIYIYAARFAQTMERMCGRGFRDKHIPKEIKMLKPALLNIFLDTFVKGDGYKRGTRDILYTSSPILADDLQEIILKTGKNSVIHKRGIMGQKKWIKDHLAISSCDGYIISRTNNGAKAKFNKRTTATTEYAGKTYCVSVPNGLIMTRRGGYAMWSGNSGVDDEIYKSAEGSLTGINTLVVLLGNGIRNLGYFYDSHYVDRLHWQTLQFDGEQSPIVESNYVERMEVKYGRESDEFKIRVKGKFPTSEMMDEQGWIPLLVNKQINQISEGIPFIGRKILGIDPSGEGDDTTRWVMRDNFQSRVIATEITSNEKTIARKTYDLMKEFDLNPNDVIIDNFGVGANVKSEILLLNHNYNVTAINWAEDAEDIEVYLNKRAECCFRGRDWIIKGGAIVGDELKRDIAGFAYTNRATTGKKQIMDKPKLKLRIGRSPDRGDAFFLTFYNDIDLKKQEENNLVITQSRQSDIHAAI